MPVHYEKRGKVGLFTLDNPPVNALTPRMHKEMLDLIEAFNADTDVHVGIMTGAGTRAFCGGDDIKNDWGRGSLEEILDAHFWPSTEASIDSRPGYERELKHVERYKPIIGAINGPAMGMGAIYIMLHTDIRIATANARLGFPEIKYGMGGAGGTTQLAKRLPQAVAYWLLLTGEPLQAEDAIRHGLFNELVEPEALLDRAFAVAETIAAHPPIAVRVEMELIKRSQDLSHSEILGLTSHLYRLQRAAYLLKPGNNSTPLGGKITAE